MGRTRTVDRELTVQQINLRRIREESGHSQATFDAWTAHLGGAGLLKPGRTNAYEIGKANPPEPYLAFIAEKLKLDRGVFDIEIGKPLPPLEVPYWGVVPCGNWEAPSSDPETVEVDGKFRGAGDIVAVRTSGKSMLPLLSPGALVPILRGPLYGDGHVVLAHNEHGELSLKIARYAPEGWELRSANKDYPPVSADKITVLGRALDIPGISSTTGVVIEDF